MIQLYRGDCLDVMKRIPEGAIDFVLTDPPYGVTACKWDSVIPFAPMWEQIHRVAKRNAAIALFCSQPFTSALVMSNVERFKYEWVWDKQKATGHLNAKARPMFQHEAIAIFSCGKPPYFPQMRTGFNPYTVFSGHGSDNYNKQTATLTVNDGTRYPISLLQFPRCKSKLHPTQKPVALLEYLIRTYTLPGETVLDFTTGSGSTGVAAISTGRNFIGVELNREYFAIAEKRLGEIYDDAPLAGYPKKEQQT